MNTVEKSLVREVELRAADGGKLARLSLSPMKFESGLARIILQACEQDDRTNGKEDVLSALDALIAEVDPESVVVGLARFQELFELVHHDIGQRVRDLDSVDIHFPCHAPKSNSEVAR